MKVDSARAFSGLIRKGRHTPRVGPSHSAFVISYRCARLTVPDGRRRLIPLIYAFPTSPLRQDDLPRRARAVNFLVYAVVHLANVVVP